MPTNPDCPFCPPPPDRVIERGRLVTAIRDGFAVSPGHTLVTPNRHVASWFETTPEERQAIFKMIDHVKHRLDESHQPAGYNLGINIGRAAGQTVFHVHVHVIPRYEGDVDDPRGGVRRLIPGKGNYIPSTDRRSTRPKE